MTRDFDKMIPQEKFDHLLKVLESERFLKKEGLGNEVPFFICAYSPKDSTAMDRLRQQLKKRLGQQGINILDINLYDLSLEILQGRKSLERIIEVEPNVSKAELKELLQGLLDSEKHLAPAISEKMAQAQFDIMFLSGVGEVFPYIRSHNVLNNLQSIAKEKPTVMFFPGEFTHSLEDGASLDLFGRLHDDKYYRAFNISNCEV